jgi:aldehyde:ferredoxin oxidoreductase
MKKTDVLQYAMQSKGIGIGAHGIRSGKDYPEKISYACSVQRGDHTSTTGLPIDGSESEAWEIFNDSGVYCNFNSFGVTCRVRLDFYKAVTGLELTPEEWSRTKALRILQLQRAMLLLGGPDIKWNPKTDDDNPPRFYEPLRSGPYKGKTAEKAKVKEDKKMYYRQAGWDTSGIPKSETLRKLGLNDVDKTLDKIRH